MHGITYHVMLVSSLLSATSSGLAVRYVTPASIQSPIQEPVTPDVKLNILQSNAQFNFQPYALTDASINCTKPASQNSSTDYSCNIQFDWYDPNSASESNLANCTCTYMYMWDGKPNPPDEDYSYQVCRNLYPSIFKMSVDSFYGPDNFTLMITHFYKDSSLWGSPYVYVQTWASPSINMTQRFSDATSMIYSLQGPILANITGLTG